MKAPDIVTLSVRIPKPWGEALERLAAAEYLKISDIARRALHEFLKSQGALTADKPGKK